MQAPKEISAAKVHVQLWLPRELHAAVKEAAAKDDHPISVFIKRIVAQEMRKKRA